MSVKHDKLIRGMYGVYYNAIRINSPSIRFQKRVLDFISQLSKCDTVEDFWNAINNGKCDIRIAGVANECLIMGNCTRNMTRKQIIQAMGMVTKLKKFLRSGVYSFVEDNDLGYVLQSYYPVFDQVVPVIKIEGDYPIISYNTDDLLTKLRDYRWQFFR